MMVSSVPDPVTTADHDRSATAWLEHVESVMAAMATASRGRELDALADGVVATFDAAWVRIWLFEPHDDALHLRASAGLSDLPAGVRTRIPRQDPDSPVIAALLRGETVILDDIGPDSGVRWAEWLAARGVRSYAGFALRVEGRLVGVMAVLGWAPWSPPALAALRVLTRQAALKLDQTRLLESAAGHIERLTSLGGITRQLLAAGELDAVLSVVVDAGARLCGASGAMVSLLDSERRALRVAACTGPMSGLFALHAAGRPLDERYLAESATGRALTTKQPVVVEDYATWPSSAAMHELMEDVGVRAFIAAPLLVGGEAIGVLWVGDAEPRAFVAADIAMVEALADQAAIAIEHARLYAQAREDARRTRTLAETAASVAIAGSLDRVLADLAQRVVESSGAQACAIFVTAADLTAARLAGMQGLPLGYARAIETAMQQGQLTFSLEELEPDRPIVRHNVWETYLATPVFAHLLPYRAQVAWDMTVIVPLVTRGRKRGILATYYHHDQEPDSDERTFLAAVGNQAAIAVENARLLVTAQEKASLEERARLARDLHDSATQTVFSMGMLAQAAQRQHERGAEQLGATLTRVAALAKQAHAELRALLFELRPDVALEHGLEQGLRQLVDAVRARSTSTIAFVGETLAAIPQEQAHALFRIVQEALNNTVKHARARHVTVTLSEEPGAVRVSVVDDGVGFDPALVAAHDQGHLGLRSMRERAATAGLVLEVASTPGIGTVVQIVAPSRERNEPHGMSNED
jgi:signal transduction histidine kinase